MIPDRPDRVPDSIEPLIGYRAWFFTDYQDEAALYPISSPDPASKSAWDGANRRWVSAMCGFEGALAISEHMKQRLEHIASKLGPTIGSFQERAPHTIPGENCSCGFYAMKTLASLPRRWGPNIILGRVQLAGKVIECALGYRAERARIAELILIAESEGSAERLALHLGLPLGPRLPDGPRLSDGPWLPLGPPLPPELPPAA